MLYIQDAQGKKLFDSEGVIEFVAQIYFLLNNYAPIKVTWLVGLVFNYLRDCPHFLNFLKSKLKENFATNAIYSRRSGQDL